MKIGEKARRYLSEEEERDLTAKKYSFSKKKVSHLFRVPSFRISPNLTGATLKRRTSLVSSFIYEIEEAKESGDTEIFVRLLKAIENNKVDEISEMLKRGIEPWDLIDFSSQTHVLLMAARYADESVLDSLFSNPAVLHLVNMADIRGTTPLIAAAGYNNVTAAQYFLRFGADTEAKLIESKETALHFAADLENDEICNAILSYNNKKSLINAVDIEGNTALMVAVAADSPCVDALLKAGSDYLKKNFITGRNILHQAIMNVNNQLVETLVAEYSEREFLDSPDNFGDSPLMTAIRSDNEEAVSILLKSRHVEMILPRAQFSLHNLVQNGKTQIFNKLLEMIQDKTYFNFEDDRGRPLILYAVELNKYDIFNAMVAAGVDYKTRNRKTGETIIHVASYFNHVTILNFILKAEDVGDLMEVKDHGGMTPCEIIIGKLDRNIWRKFTRLGLLPYRYCNDSQESSLFIAAKNGNYELVISILFSEKFNHLYDSTHLPLERSHLIKLELQGLIYTSDLYLLMGIVSENRKWQVCPIQGDLFQFTENGQNIFHACALGNNLSCLTLIYEYCLHYRKGNLEDLDRPDNNGNTPLILALLSCSGQDLCKYLMKKGADLTKMNKSNQTALEVMIATLPNFQSMLTEVINECVFFDSTSFNKNKQYDELKIIYQVFCPPGKTQTAVIEHIFSRLKGRNDLATIKNPVIEHFVMCKWNRIEKMVGFRFVLYSLFIVLFSTYMSFTFCKFLSVDRLISEVMVFLILLLAIIMTCFSTPYIFLHNKGALATCIVISAPLLIMSFMVMERYSRSTLEMGAAGVLFGWFAILILGSVTKMSFQIIMFFDVLRQVPSYLPTCLIILCAYSICYFLLFHNFYLFNSPIHSFVTTAVLLLHGDNKIPVFNPNVQPQGDKKDLFKAVDFDKGVIDGKSELHGLMVEGIMHLLFNLFINICFLNMLVGLAVRGGEVLELEGHINRARTYVKEINAWELFVQSKFYKFAKKCNILWLIGVASDLEERLLIPTVHSPLSDIHVSDNNLNRLRQFAISNSQIPESPILMAKDLLLTDVTHLSMLGEGITKKDNIMWIYSEKEKNTPEPEPEPRI